MSDNSVVPEKRKVGRPKGYPKSGGRRKGIPNKVTAQLKEVFVDILSDPAGIEAMRQQYREGKLPPAVWCRMVDQVIGRAKEPSENLRRDIRVMFGGRYLPDEMSE